ncbi:hypothetical protein FHETE_6011 [Fusarium heterosporum]|uniref:Uncharacterized protein n=1 Tax=Fusarium heterosporum TaxID=42747 RepID=A0A8H5WR65_FUSHE|nr:hypothetical protein FHETE_6011 [Fusarium heterosporum]
MPRGSPHTPYGPRTPSAPRTPRTPSRAQEFARYARNYPSTPVQSSEQESEKLLLSRITDVEELSARLSEATTPDEAKSIFQRDLVSVDPNLMLRVLQDTIRKTHPSTELHRQALQKERALRKAEDLKAGDPRAINIVWLNRQWKGSQWLPEDVRLASATSGSRYEPSNGLVNNMVKITEILLEKGIALHSLWTNGGPLRNAVSCHLEGEDRKVVDLVQGYPLFGLSQEIIDITVDCIGLPVTNNRPCEHNAQKAPRKRPRQVRQTPTSRYSRFKDTLNDLKPEDLNILRDQAMRDLEKAEDEKAAADFALGSLKGRQDQIQEIRQHSDMYLQHQADDQGNGYRASECFIGDLLKTADKVYIEGLLELRQSLLQTYPGSQGQFVDKTLQARHAEAVKDLRETKQRVYALDRLQKAAFVQKSCNEMRGYRRKIKALLAETEGSLETMEAACMQAFHDSESEDWASIIAKEKNEHH